MPAIRDAVILKIWMFPMFVTVTVVEFVWLRFEEMLIIDTLVESAGFDETITLERFAMV